MDDSGNRTNNVSKSVDHKKGIPKNACVVFRFYVCPCSRKSTKNTVYLRLKIFLGIALARSQTIPLASWDACLITETKHKVLQVYPQQTHWHHGEEGAAVSVVAWGLLCSL
mmetsp:Transcript_20543/g.43055  ORF Transcript_20543/g.43055 Transcript_20543/m.43055 type:complete len:111 (-) Transcript_20543:2-334(-)